MNKDRTIVKGNERVNYYNKLSKLILRKTNSYFKISLIMFIASFLLISTSVIIFMDQYTQVEKDFLKNNNVLFIEVRPGFINNKKLEFDMDTKGKISQFLDLNFPKAHCSVIGQYALYFGLTDENDVIHDRIIVLDNNASKFIKAFKLQDDTIYVHNNSSASSLSFKITKKSILNGKTSDITEHFRVKIINTDYTKIPFIINRNDITDNLEILNYNTLTKIMKIMQMDGMKVTSLERVYVFTDNIKYIKKMANALEDNNYTTTYSLNAFDDLYGSLKNSTVVFVIMGLIIFMGTTLNTLLSFKSYIKIQQKDMGILKQLGFNNKNLFRTYKVTINNIFLKFYIIIEIYITVLGLIFLQNNFIRLVLPMLFVSFILLFIVNRIVIYLILRKYINKNILDLLKTSKEFE